MCRLMTKPTKWHVRPAKTQISLGIRPVSSESSLFTWRKLGSMATHWGDSEDTDQTGRTPRLIWIFTGCTVILLILSWGGSSWARSCERGKYLRPWWASISVQSTEGGKYLRSWWAYISVLWTEPSLLCNTLKGLRGCFRQIPGPSVGNWP